MSEESTRAGRASICVGVGGGYRAAPTRQVVALSKTETSRHAVASREGWCVGASAALRAGDGDRHATGGSKIFRGQLG